MYVYDRHRHRHRHQRQHHWGISPATDTKTSSWYLVTPIFFLREFLYAVLFLFFSFSVSRWLELCLLFCLIFCCCCCKKWHKLIPKSGLKNTETETESVTETETGSKQVSRLQIRQWNHMIRVLHNDSYDHYWLMLLLEERFLQLSSSLTSFINIFKGTPRQPHLFPVHFLWKMHHRKRQVSSWSTYLAPLVVALFISLFFFFHFFCRFFACLGLIRLQSMPEATVSALLTSKWLKQGRKGGSWEELEPRPSKRLRS